MTRYLSLNQQGVIYAVKVLHLSLLRATEVLYGSATALVFSWIYRRALLHWTHEKDDDEEPHTDRATP